MVNRERARFLFFGLLLALRSLGEAPLHWARSLWPATPASRGVFRLRYLQLTLVPLFLFGCFYGLYATANARFAQLSSGFWNGLFDWLGGVFNGVDLLYFLLGLIVTGAALYHIAWPKLDEWIATVSEVLQRHRNGGKRRRYFHTLPALKREYRSGVVLFVLVNVLLFFVNLTDLLYVWGPQEAMTAYETKQYVHEGTYLLIASILLAAGIVLYFFRGNLNFYQNNNLLKRLTYAWIAQNALLTASVAARNYHYIHEYGLAFKRIGVIVFLLSTLTGLFWLFRKVQLRRSAYYLWHRNTWSVFFILFLTATVNWSRLITTYNLTFHETDRTDWTFLLRDLPASNSSLLLAHLEAHPMDTPVYERRLVAVKNRQLRYEEELAGYSWLSWNWADATIYGVDSPKQ